jgi:hypothetical protein
MCKWIHRRSRDRYTVVQRSKTVNIELEIEGVADRGIADAIRKRVRTLGRHIDRSGECRVTLVPSETRAVWDLGIRAASRWHVASFIAPMEQLPDIVDQTLRERLVVLAFDGAVTAR